MKRILVVVMVMLGALGVGAYARAVQQPALVAVTFTTGPAWDAGKAPNLQAGFAEHSANLARLRKEGRIALGGRYGQFGMVLVKAESEAAARELFRDDPTMTTGVFKAEFNRWQTFYAWQAL